MRACNKVLRTSESGHSSGMTLSSNRHPVLSHAWSMIFPKTGSPTFRDHALTGALLCPPGLDQAGQIGRLCLVVDEVRRDVDPRLRAARPDVADRLEPRRIVERARLDDRDLRIELR